MAILLVEGAADRALEGVLEASARDARGAGDLADAQPLARPLADQPHGVGDVRVVGGLQVGRLPPRDPGRRELGERGLPRAPGHHVRQPPGRRPPEPLAAEVDRRQRRVRQVTLDVVAVGREDRHLARHRNAPPPAGRRELLGVVDLEAEHPHRLGERGHPVAHGSRPAVPILGHAVTDRRVGVDLEPGGRRRRLEPLPPQRRRGQVVEERQPSQPALAEVIHRHLRHGVLVVGDQAEAVEWRVVEQQHRRHAQGHQEFQVGPLVNGNAPVRRIVGRQVGPERLALRGEQDFPQAVVVGVFDHALDHRAVVGVARVKAEHHPHGPVPRGHRRSQRLGRHATVVPGRSVPGKPAPL